MKQFRDLVVGKWGAQIKGYQFPCSVGRSGIGKKTYEGDGITPEGTWRLVFFMARFDRLGYDFRAVDDGIARRRRLR